MVIISVCFDSTYRGDAGRSRETPDQAHFWDTNQRTRNNLPPEQEISSSKGGGADNEVQVSSETQVKHIRAIIQVRRRRKRNEILR